MDLLKGYRERFCFPADPVYRDHILNIWVWAQVKYVSLHRSVSLLVIICYWVQAILLVIYSLGHSKQYLLHQIVEPSFRKRWYRWHKPCTFGDFKNTIYRAADLWEILEESRKARHGQRNYRHSEVVSDFLSVLRNATTSIFGKSWASARWKSVLFHVNCGSNTVWRYEIYIYLLLET